MSPMLDLRAKYGEGKTRQVINRAIRAECPGGPEALKAIETIHHMLDRHGWETLDGRPSPLAESYLQMLRVLGAMEDDIRQRYAMPRRTGRPNLDNLRRGSKQ